MKDVEIIFKPHDYILINMLASKIFTSTLLLSNTYLLTRKHQQEKQSECAGSDSAEKGAKDLDTIFASQEGGMPPDPEEI